jgi:signal transduction histidine kinase
VTPNNIIFSQLTSKLYELKRTNENLTKAKAKVESTENLFNKFINFIPDGVLVIRNGEIEFVNKCLLKMIKIENEGLLIHKHIFDIIDIKYHEIILYRINSADATLLGMPQEYELNFNGTKLLVEITSLIATDEKGDYLISTIRDIREKKVLEEKEQLLKLKKREDQLKDEFFTNISHELKTPINVIYSALQLETQYLDNFNKESIIKCNKIINQNCLRLIRLVNNLIDITRIDSGSFKPNIEIQNIVPIVEDITQSIINYSQSKNINLLFDTELEEAYVACDLDLIERITLNLLSNSVKYGLAYGNIKVYIYQPSHTSISISIKDDGIGISEEIKPKIFNKFIKEDNSLSRETEGIGTSLFLVKKFVEMQGGTITFNSKLDRGTEFIINFQLADHIPEIAFELEKVSICEKSIIKLADIEFSDLYI